MSTPATDQRRVSLCVCPGGQIPKHTPALRCDILPDIETGILTLPFAIACTLAEKETLIWRDARDLVSYLIGFDWIQTFNGNSFDFVVLAAEIARVPEIQDTANSIWTSDEFRQVYCALNEKSFDLFSVIRDIMGARVSMANVASATYGKTRAYTVEGAVEALYADDLLTTVNYVLEGCTMASDLCHIQQSLRKLVITRDNGQKQVIDM